MEACFCGRFGILEEICNHGDWHLGRLAFLEEILEIGILGDWHSLEIGIPGDLAFLVTWHSWRLACLEVCILRDLHYWRLAFLEISILRRFAFLEI